MKQIGFLVMMAVLTSGMIGATNRLDTSKSSDGKSLFLESKCQNCHSIKSQSIAKAGEPKPGEKAPPDLSNVGTKHNADWISKWLMKEEEMNGKKHLKKFKGSDADLKTLATWLASLKSH